jgi:hypothetical protein
VDSSHTGQRVVPMSCENNILEVFHYLVDLYFVVTKRLICAVVVVVVVVVVVIIIIIIIITIMSGFFV